MARRSKTCFLRLDCIIKDRVVIPLTAPVLEICLSMRGTVMHLIVLKRGSFVTLATAASVSLGAGAFVQPKVVARVGYLQGFDYRIFWDY